MSSDDDNAASEPKADEALALVLDECAKAMLAAYGLDATKLEDPLNTSDESPAITAFLGFGAQGMRGAMTMIAPIPLLQQTYPEVGQLLIGEADFADWGCELLNQLVGRFKNQLSRKGVLMEVNTPLGVVAARVRLAPGNRRSLIARAYRAGGSGLLVVMDSNLTVPNVAQLGALRGADGVSILASEPDTPSPRGAGDVPSPAAEGELLLF
jgi:hypothetical protein